jgi:hypothetical protein
LALRSWWQPYSWRRRGVYPPYTLQHCSNQKYVQNYVLS